MDIRCSRCGAPMTCEPGRCWCEAYPPLARVDQDKGCYCPSCLKSLTEVSGRDQTTAASGKSP